jgi:hypothetical protein
LNRKDAENAEDGKDSGLGNGMNGNGSPKSKVQSPKSTATALNRKDAENAEDGKDSGLGNGMNGNGRPEAKVNGNGSPKSKVQGQRQRL